MTDDKSTAVKANTLALWNRVEKTDPEQTRPITGKNYKGTSPRPHYLIWRATEAFGPCGIGWGFKILSERIVEGAGHDRVHIAHVQVWYIWQGELGEVEHVGETMFSGVRRDGTPYTDEDAPKKSVTDALIKALSMIGFAGDVFMGRFDDSKYVSELRDEFKQPNGHAIQALNQEPVKTSALDIDGNRTAPKPSALRESVKTMTDSLTISNEQCEALENLRKKAKVPLERFLLLMNVDAVGDLPVSQFQRAKNNLDKKIRENEEVARAKPSDNGRTARHVG